MTIEGAALLFFDLVAGGLVLVLAWLCLMARDAQRMITLFIAFGVLVGLVWVRLRAPDIALAEAALGGALTGALLLRSRTLFEVRRLVRPDMPIRLCAAVAATFFAAALSWVWLTLPPAAPVDLGALTAENMSASGVSHPVTAVLLNFRAFDTMMEMPVVLLAAIGCWMLGEARPASSPVRDNPLFQSLARIVVPVLCVLAGYLLWLGSTAPGGAFQAGAVLAGTFILLLLAGIERKLGAPGALVWIRVGLVAGLAVFVSVAWAMGLSGRSMLEYPPGSAKPFILLIEVTLTISVGLTLAALFLGGKPRRRTNQA